VWEALCIAHTLNHLKELGLGTQKAHKTALKLHAHSVLVHTNCQLLDGLLKNPVALNLKVLVWSRGQPVTLQILTSFSFSLVGGLTALRANVSPFPLLM